MPPLIPFTPAGDQHQREVGIEMQVGVGEASPVQDHRVIEQRAIAIWRVIELAQVVGQHLHVQSVDLCRLFLLLAVALVMRAGVMRVAKSEFRIGAAAHLMTHLERNDAGHVGLPRQHQSDQPSA